ncbi:MAG: SBBP repeat-containing protein, partial [Acidobacteriaceae bacterium]
MNRKSAWSTVLLLTLVGTTALAQASAPSTQPVSPAPAKKSVRYGQLPLSFEPNVGQSSHEVQWLSRGQDYTLFLSGPDAVLEVSRVAPDAKHGGAAKVDTTALRMNLLGGSVASASTGEEPQTGKVNYFTGNNSADWHRNVSLFGRVRLRQVYPGIDLAYYGHQGQLEYDFIVAPEADASAIRLRFDGATPQLAGNGDLVLPVNGSEVRFHQPVVYQMQDGVRQPVDGRFTMAKNHEVTFALGAYDKSRELVIDPTLVYTGTFGTASESDAPAAMAVDAKGELIITGATYDLNFPATSGAYQTACGPVSATDTQNGVFRCAVGDQPGALSSAYIAKLSADGTSLVYATYLHGITGWEKGSAVQADAAGNAVVVGQTASADFPLVHAPAIAQMSLCQPHIPLAGGPPVQTCNGYFDGGGTEWTIQGPSGFVTKLSADGSTLLYSAFLGFSGTTYPQSLALDASGNMYILSEINDADPNPNTSNPDEVLYPTTSTAFQTGGVGDYGTAFTALSADGQTILYSTIYGETQPIDSGCGSCLNGTVPSDVAVGQNGIVFIAGETRVTTLPVSADAVQTTCLQSTPTQCANNVGYVAAFDITKSGPSSLAWATYISGPDNPNTAVSTQLNSIAADADNNVYVTGYTTDALFPTTAGAYATTCPLDGRSGANFCDNSVFISKLNSTGSAYTWSTFLAPTQGASSGGTSNAIAIDAHNNVYVYGDSGNLIIPAVSPLPQYPDNWYQPYPFVSVLNPTGTNLLFSSQIAPNNYITSMQNGMALDPAGNIYLVGNTQGQQTYFEGNTTLTSWPTTKGTYTTAYTGTGPIPFFVKIAALLEPTATTLTASPTTTAAG